MSSEPQNAQRRTPCAAHGLYFDPEHADGCVLCVRERQAAQAGARGGRLTLVWLLGALSLLIGGAGIGAARSGTLERLLGRAASGPVPATAAPAAQARGPAPEGQPLRVLFVGNSLTSTNDLPAMVASLAKAASASRPFQPQAVTFGGFTLRDHLAANGVQSRLAASGPWDAVVLQEQGQRPGWPHAREQEFFASARALHALIRRAGARTMLYGTMARRDGDAGNFPGDDYAAMQRRVDDGYSQIARELGAELVPVGVAWRVLRQRRPELALWQPDGQQPTVAGTYLAACAFYAALYRKSPVANTFAAELPAADALAIQEAAAWVVLHGGASDASLAELDPAPPSKPPAEARKPDAVDAEREAAREAARAREAEQDRQRHERIAAELAARENAQERDRRNRMEAGIREQELRMGKRRVPVTMYKTAWCGACRRATTYMQREGIPFREYDVEHDLEARARSRQLNPRGTVPTLDIDGEVMIGWNEARFETLLVEAVARRTR